MEVVHSFKQTLPSVYWFNLSVVSGGESVTDD